jgi:hypothetical protein
VFGQIAIKEVPQSAKPQMELRSIRREIGREERREAPSFTESWVGGEGGLTPLLVESEVPRLTGGRDMGNDFL